MAKEATKLSSALRKDESKLLNILFSMTIFDFLCA